MEGYDASTYGERIADVYEELHEQLFDVGPTVDVLADLAQGGPALELGIGSGRVAVPLAGRGVGVHGIDASRAMVEKLRVKPGGADIPVTFGDFAEVDVDGRFKLVYVVFNTFFALVTQDDQVRCFTNVERHLADDGVFVVEAFVPDTARFDRHQRVQVDEVLVDRIRLDVVRHDPVHQRLDAQHVVVTEKGIRLYPVHARYAFPGELDLMARLARLRLRARWGGWGRERFTSASTGHVSVYDRGLHA